ncbi:MAG: hypothetical protein K2P01_03610 [Oscillospiraceae bacterium]|nr:hypothetical protein [Oscillospiraceae bacterium]
MNNYWHMMEQVTLSDQKKEEIMDMLENKGTQKGRRPSVKMMVLAAALAVGCVLSIAAGLPAQVYNFMSGGTVVFDDSGTSGVTIGISGEDPVPPIALEHDRLWFHADGQKLDITDQVDENTPYIYEHTDTATGSKGYVIVGGTVDHFGWAEIFETESGAASLTGLDYSDTYLTINGVRQPSYELSEELVEKLNNDPSYKLDTVNRPWFQAALDQLGLDW